MHLPHHSIDINAPVFDSAFRPCQTGLSGHELSKLHQLHDAIDGGSISPLGSDKVQPLADHDGLQAAVDMKFVHGVLDMVAYGRLADTHHRGNFTGRITLGQQLKDLELAPGQDSRAEVPVVLVIAIMIPAVFQRFVGLVADVRQKPVARIAG